MAAARWISALLAPTDQQAAPISRAADIDILAAASGGLPRAREPQWGDPFLRPARRRPSAPGVSILCDPF
jgi:hypothetical protein